MNEEEKGEIIEKNIERILYQNKASYTIKREDIFSKVKILKKKDITLKNIMIKYLDL